MGSCGTGCRGFPELQVEIPDILEPWSKEVDQLLRLGRDPIRGTARRFFGRERLLPSGPERVVSSPDIPAIHANPFRNLLEG